MTKVVNCGRIEPLKQIQLTHYKEVPMYRGIVFFDLDRTLLNNETQVEPEVASAMTQLRQNQILPVIATGRNLYEIKDILQATQINTIVSGNGANVHLEGRDIYRHPIDKQVVRQLIARADQLDDAVSVMNDHAYSISRHNEVAVQNYHYINTPLPAADAARFVTEEDVLMMVISTVGHDEAYASFEREFNICRNTPYSVDVVAKEISKQSGIKRLLQEFEPEIPTYAFGDGLNDLPMLQFVDHPVAMGNGLPVVKQTAEFVTTDNIDHGIVNGLRHFNLI